MKHEEKFFIPKPDVTDRKETVRYSDGRTAEFPVYQSGSEMLKWSGEFPIPDRGTRLFIRMNSIGWATVEGYFSSAGYVGLMTKATNPPTWLRRQRREDCKKHARGEKTLPQWMLDGIGCEFGNEVALKRPRKTKSTVAA